MRWRNRVAPCDQYRWRIVFAWIPTLENRTQEIVWLARCEILEFRWEGDTGWYHTSRQKPFDWHTEFVAESR